MRTLHILIAITFATSLHMVPATRAADSRVMSRDHLMLEPNDLKWADVWMTL
jgi:hypothetical protein